MIYVMFLLMQNGFFSIAINIFFVTVRFFDNSFVN